PVLPGVHQPYNAATAMAVGDVLGWKNDVLLAGLRQAKHPGRLQQLAPPPGWPAGTRLWVDGGHNPAAAKALAESFRQWRLDAPRPLVMVAAMMADKDMDGFFAALAPQCDGIWACGLPGNPRAAPAGAL